MARKIMKFLIFLDNLAEVLLFHVFFSRRNWKRTTAVLLAVTAAIALTQVSPVRKVKRPVNWAIKAERALTNGHVSRAVHYFEKAVAKHPTAPLLRSLGLAYLENQEPTKALAALQRSFSMTPSRTTLYYVGCAYQGLKLHDVALGVFEQVQSGGLGEQVMPEEAAFYAPLASAKIGECYSKKGQHARAVTHLKQVTARYPWSAQGFFYLGIAQWDGGSPDLGVKQFHRVIELSPKESSAYYNIACYYSIKGASNLALHWLDRALKVGFDSYTHMETDHDLDNIRDLPAYKTLVINAKRHRIGNR